MNDRMNEETEKQNIQSINQSIKNAKNIDFSHFFLRGEGWWDPRDPRDK